MLLDFEERQKAFLTNTSSQAHYASSSSIVDDQMVSTVQPSGNRAVTGAMGRGRSPPPYLPPPLSHGGYATRGRGCGLPFQYKPTCHICAKTGHTANRSYFRYEPTASSYGGGTAYASFTDASTYIPDNPDYYSWPEQYNVVNPTAFYSSSANHDLNATVPVVNPVINPSGTPNPHPTDSIVVANPSSDTSHTSLYSVPTIGGQDARKTDTTTTQAFIATPETIGGGVLPASYVGNARLANPTSHMHMHRVLYVPSMQKNLVSISQATKHNGVSIEFFPHTCFIKDLQTQKILMDDTKHAGMYKLSTSSQLLSPPSSTACNKGSAATSSCYHVTSSDLVSLWH